MSDDKQAESLGLAPPRFPIQAEVKIKRQLELLEDDARHCILYGSDPSQGFFNHAQSEIDFLRVGDDFINKVIEATDGYYSDFIEVEICPLNFTDINKGEKPDEFKFFRREKDLWLVGHNDSDELGFIHDGFYFPSVGHIMTFMLIDTLRNRPDKVTGKSEELIALIMDHPKPKFLDDIKTYIKEKVIV